MPGEVSTSNPVEKKGKGKSMTNSVQDHVDLPSRPWHKLCGVNKGECIAGVRASHPTTDHCEDVVKGGGHVEEDTE